ncbi:unnamed protein product [Meganyctiphanes norvegica]|uniref:Uncharacterized protein n=1 Tax=Meganyctiphanes norvegica TaxID=48144 RepID=A0AAV2RV23_MEGNR
MRRAPPCHSNRSSTIRCCHPHRRTSLGLVFLASVRQSSWTSSCSPYRRLWMNLLEMLVELSKYPQGQRAMALGLCHPDPWICNVEAMVVTDVCIGDVILTRCPASRHIQY